MPSEPDWKKRVRQVRSVEQAIPRDLRFEYPWSGLEEALQERSEDQIFLVGYGSLLHPRSAARTIADTPPGGHPPVLAFGARRLFDYVMPMTFIERYRAEGAEEFPPTQRAALNTRWTGDPSDVLNGRLIPLSIGDLDGLREREKGYDLEPVATVPWDQPDQRPSVGFVLCATSRPWQGKVFIDGSIEPYPPYLELCREGARLTGEDFEQCLIDTCWLADAQTPLAAWLV